MATQQDQSRLPNLKFRVLIIGRANAGKTTILQRVCDTTESPEIYRLGPGGTRYRVELDPTTERGQHDINDELTFTNHDGYIFHDSRGFESGSGDELKIVREFVQRKSQEKSLKNRLHAIWYCIPMDNDRPSLDLRYFGEICPDKNVPVIALFTKYDQFKRDVRIKLKDEGREQDMDLNTEIENKFKRHYLAGLNGSPPFVLLEKMHKGEPRCADLIYRTANALSGGAVALMLMAVQRDNMELSVKQAIIWAHPCCEQETETVIKKCIIAFPVLWLWDRELLEELLEGRILSRRRDRSLGLELELEGKRAKLLFDKLRSFTSNPPSGISSDSKHHTMIVTTLILERAALFHASPSRPTLGDALDQACSQYESSDAHNAFKEQFSLPPTQYSISQFKEFVLSHRL